MAEVTALRGDREGVPRAVIARLVRVERPSGKSSRSTLEGRTIEGKSVLFEGVSIGPMASSMK
jgi:hypothetical protein